MNAKYHISSAKMHVNIVKSALDELADCYLVEIHEVFADYLNGYATLDEFLKKVDAFTDNIDVWANAVEYLTTAESIIKSMEV